jgi:hypothetical protein
LIGDRITESVWIRIDKLARECMYCDMDGGSVYGMYIDGLVEVEKN